LCDLRLRSIAAVAPDATIRQAAQVMRGQDIAALVVAEPGQRIAIVTERDLTAAIADGHDLDTTVLDVASPTPLTTAHDATVMDAAITMLGEGVRHLVVTRGDHAIGVVSIRDLLAVLLQTVTPDTVFLMVHQAALGVAAPIPGSGRPQR
jgi:CBS domain-containing protein